MKEALYDREPILVGSACPFSLSKAGVSDYLHAINESQSPEAVGGFILCEWREAPP